MQRQLSAGDKKLHYKTCLPALATTNSLGRPKMLLSMSNSMMMEVAASKEDTTT